MIKNFFIALTSRTASSIFGYILLTFLGVEGVINLFDIHTNMAGRGAIAIGYLLGSALLGCALYAGFRAATTDLDGTTDRARNAAGLLIIAALLITVTLDWASATDMSNTGDTYYMLITLFGGTFTATHLLHTLVRHLEHRRATTTA